jgi:secreted trypsin-like serine protease
MTFILLVLFLHCSAVVAGESSSSLRGGNAGVDNRNLIIGGAPAIPGDYPYFVHYESPGCGGTLIAPDIVLTAGHCKMDNVADYKTIYVGRHNLSSDKAQSFTAVDQSRHAAFNDQVCCGYHDQDWYYGVFNDFLLLKLSGESSSPVIRLNSRAARPQRGQELHVIGFGDMHPEDPYRPSSRLRDVTVNYLTNQQCVASSIYPATVLDDSSMCASDFREDACGGDSGGPLIAKGRTDAYDVQVGVVSWYVVSYYC